ncbi:hypothetical protein CI102_11079 [Trichoderma harzianum]|nr:hypothetical protein CI102_11079 [Trichoderma harzianum]
MMKCHQQALICSADHQTRVNTFRNPRPRPKPCCVICSGRRPSRNLLLLSKSSIYSYSAVSNLGTRYAIENDCAQWLSGFLCCFALLWALLGLVLLTANCPPLSIVQREPLELRLPWETVVGIDLRRPQNRQSEGPSRPTPLIPRVCTSQLRQSGNIPG